MISRGNVLAGWVVFLFLPILFLTWGWVQGIEQARRHGVQTLAAESARLAREIAAAGQASHWVKEWFYGRGQAQPPLTAHRANSGERCPGFPALEWLIEFLQGRPDIPEEQLRRARDQVGWGFNPYILQENPGTPIEVRWLRSQAWLIWSGESATVSAALFVPPSPLALTRQAMKQADMLPNQSAVVIDLETRTLSRRGKPSLARLQRILQKRGGKSTLSGRMADGAWHLEILPNGLGIYAETRPTSPGPSLPAGFPLVVGGILLLFGTILLPRLANRIPDLPLQGKLPTAFGWLLLLPLFATGVVWLGLDQDLQRRSEIELLQAARRELLQVDRGFRTHLRSTEKRLRRFINDPDLRAGRLPAFRARLERWLSHQLVSRMEVFDWEGKVDVLVTPGTDRGLDDLESMIAARDIAEGKGETFEIGLSPRRTVLNEILDNPQIGFQENVRKRDVLHLYRVGSNINFGLRVLYPYPSKSPVAVAVAFQTQENETHLYLRKTLVKNRPFLVFSRRRASEGWLPRHPGKEVETLGANLIQSGEEKVGRVRFDNRWYLGVGLEARDMSHHDLFALIPEESLRQKALQMRRQFHQGLVLALLVGGGAAALLISGLLRPIRDLESGIARIRARQYSPPVPERSGDEMGRLAGMFNHLMETLGEMDMARIVQDHLLPKEPPTIPGYEVGFLCGMSSTIGGDYLDFFPLPDSRLAILVGDVAGQGVGAALVMAMAKSAIFLHFDEGGEASTLLPRLNGALCDLNRKRQTMAFCLVVLDWQRHSLTVFLAGNPSPLLWRKATADAHFLSRPAFPLGVQRNRAFPPLEERLEPGDLFFLFTDGLLAVNPGTFEAPGFDGLQRFVMTQAGRGPQFLIETSRAALENRRDALRDDVVVLALARSGKI